MKAINPKDISLLNRLRMIKAFFAVVRDVERTNEVFAISEKIPDSAVLTAVDFVASGKYSERAFREQYVLGKVDLIKFRSFPDGTLGREYARFMDARGLDPEFYPPLELTSRSQYIRLHLYQTHDLWHVVTGFDSSPAGELGLQAFYYAQIDLPLPIMLIAAGLLNALIYAPGDVTRRLDEITHGWKMGRETRKIFGYPWQENWETPISEIRREFELTSALAAPPLQLSGTARHA